MSEKHDITGHDPDHIKAVLAGAAGTFPSMSPAIIKAMAWDAIGLIELLEAEVKRLGSRPAILAMTQEWKTMEAERNELKAELAKVYRKHDEIVWGFHIDEGRVSCNCEFCVRYNKHLDH